MPLNRRYPLGGAGRGLRPVRGGDPPARLSIEWALIDGVNDRPTDAGELARFARPLAAHVNLIPLNPTPGYAVRGTPRHRVRALRRGAGGLGVNATVRVTRGAEIDAACGQLAGGGRTGAAANV